MFGLSDRRMPRGGEDHRNVERIEEEYGAVQEGKQYRSLVAYREQEKRHGGKSRTPRLCEGDAQGLSPQRPSAVEHHDKEDTHHQVLTESRVCAIEVFKLQRDGHHREEGRQERKSHHAVEEPLREPRKLAWSKAQELVEDDQVEGKPHDIDGALDGSVGKTKEKMNSQDRLAQRATSGIP